MQQGAEECELDSLAFIRKESWYLRSSGRTTNNSSIRYLRDSLLRPLAKKPTINWTVEYNITIPSITGFLGYMVFCIYRRCRHDCGGLVVGQTVTRIPLYILMGVHSFKTNLTA